jgi:hypothetical protein
MVEDDAGSAMRLTWGRRRPHGDEVLRCGDLAVDLRVGILECLASDPGRVVSRQDILNQAWDAHWYGPMKALDVHIAVLRKKLGEPKMIETVCGRYFGSLIRVETPAPARLPRADDADPGRGGRAPRTPGVRARLLRLHRRHPGARHGGGRSRRAAR